jgi:hypothetical protein
MEGGMSAIHACFDVSLAQDEILAAALVSAVLKKFVRANLALGRVLGPDPKVRNLEPTQGPLMALIGT